MVWPGLNAPVIQGKELVEQSVLPPDPDREAKLIRMRDSMGQFRALKLNPMERGWSGAKMHGRSCGPPEPIGQGWFCFLINLKKNLLSFLITHVLFVLLDTFEGFDTRIIEVRFILIVVL